MDEESPLIDGGLRTPGYGASPRGWQPGRGSGTVRSRGGLSGMLASCAPGCFSDAESRRVEQPGPSMYGGGGGGGGLSSGALLTTASGRR